jgi:hypothetical protein
MWLHTIQLNSYYCIVAKSEKKKTKKLQFTVYKKDMKHDLQIHYSVINDFTFKYTQIYYKMDRE